MPSLVQRFKIAQQPLERGMSLLSRNSTSSRYSWPGTYEVIELTDRKFLKVGSLEIIKFKCTNYLSSVSYGSKYNFFSILVSFYNAKD